MLTHSTACKFGQAPRWRAILKLSNKLTTFTMALEGHNQELVQNRQ